MPGWEDTWGGGPAQRRKGWRIGVIDGERIVGGGDLEGSSEWDVK